MIGGRGTGKSTIVESIRFALEQQPSGEQAMANHQKFVDDVLGPGATVTLLVRSHTPADSNYAIIRTVGSRPVVLDGDDVPTDLHPRDIVGSLSIYGQHEIADLARMPAELTLLLDRFVADDGSLAQGTDKDSKAAIRETRERILTLRRESDELADDLEALSGLLEKRHRFNRLGLNKKLKEKSDLIEERAILEDFEETVEEIRAANSALSDLVPVDLNELTDKSLAKLGGKDILKRAKPILKALGKAILTASTNGTAAITLAQDQMEVVTKEWTEREKTVGEAHESTLRELKRQGIDGREYERVLAGIKRLQPKKARLTSLEIETKEAGKERRIAIEDWRKHRDKRFADHKSAARRVNRRLKGIVKIEVTQNGDRSALSKHVRSLGGRTADVVRTLEAETELSINELADAIREGATSLTENYNLAPRHAEVLVEAGEDFVMRLEELDLATTSESFLNTGRVGESEEWRSLSDLSTGQKATAVLMLMLLESPDPLVIDQPEDDLDNRFISEIVVPRIRVEKHRRQFVLSSHNANLPVLGDAEQIVALASVGPKEEPADRIPDRNRGSIDSKAIQDLVTETLEGGREAFETRRLKYNF